MNINPVYQLRCGTLIHLDHLAAINPVADGVWELVVQHQRIQINAPAEEIAAISWAWSCRCLNQEKPCKTDL